MIVAVNKILHVKNDFLFCTLGMLRYQHLEQENCHIVQPFQD
jgi:hypothetical protein